MYLNEGLTTFAPFTGSYNEYLNEGLTTFAPSRVPLMYIINVYLNEGLTTFALRGFL